MAERLIQLRMATLEIEVYPSDIAMSGQKAIVARARAAIASRLTATAAHLTTSREAQAIEDRIEQVAQVTPEARSALTGGLPAGVAESLRAIDATLAVADVDYDEWELLYRMRLQVERDLRIGTEVGERFESSAHPAVASAAGPSARPPVTEWALAAAIAAGIAADVGLAVWDKVRRGQP